MNTVSKISNAIKITIETFLTTFYCSGAGHTDEILYIWYNQDFASDLTGKDLKLSKKLVKIWTDFAKYGSEELHIFLLVILYIT